MQFTKLAVSNRGKSRIKRTATGRFNRQYERPLVDPRWDEAVLQIEIDALLVLCVHNHRADADDFGGSGDARQGVLEQAGAEAGFKPPRRQDARMNAKAFSFRIESLWVGAHPLPTLSHRGRWLEIIDLIPPP